MNVPLSRCVMVGDMHTDINMGKSVGSVTIGVLTGIFTKEKLLELNPDFIIDSVADIPEIIDEILELVDQN
jgi:phosphoglycolate phosphatase-like HAD superfamily hydrolase